MHAHLVDRGPQEAPVLVVSGLEVCVEPVDRFLRDGARVRDCASTGICKNGLFPGIIGVNQVVYFKALSANANRQQGVEVGDDLRCRFRGAAGMPPGDRVSI